MRNELIHLGRPGGDDGDGHHEKAFTNTWEEGFGEDEEWDLPPIDPVPGPVHDRQSRSAARHAEQQAAAARRRGDTTFAHIREGDAGDLRQGRLDWGDARTWLWIAGMCALFLGFALLCYYMPYGRHASPPGARYY